MPYAVSESSAKSGAIVLLIGERPIPQTPRWLRPRDHRRRRRERIACGKLRVLDPRNRASWDEANAFVGVAQSFSQRRRQSVAPVLRDQHARHEREIIRWKRSWIDRPRASGARAIQRDEDLRPNSPAIVALDPVGRVTAGDYRGAVSAAEMTEPRAAFKCERPVGADDHRVRDPLIDDRRVAATKAAKKLALRVSAHRQGPQCSAH